MPRTCSAVKLGIEVNRRIRMFLCTSLHEAENGQNENEIVTAGDNPNTDNPTPEDEREIKEIVDQISLRHPGWTKPYILDFSTRIYMANKAKWAGETTQTKGHRIENIRNREIDEDSGSDPQEHGQNHGDENHGDDPFLGDLYVQRINLFIMHQMH